MTNLASDIPPAPPAKDVAATAPASPNGAALLSAQFDRNSRAFAEAGTLLQKNAKVALTAGGVATRSAQVLVQKTAEDSRKLFESTVEGVGRALEARTPEQFLASQQSLFSAYAAVLATSLSTAGDLIHKTSQDLIAHWSDPLLATVEHFQKAGARA